MHAEQEEEEERKEEDGQNRIDPTSIPR